jgi:hypothetical protein
VFLKVDALENAKYQLRRREDIASQIKDLTNADADHDKADSLFDQANDLDGLIEEARDGVRAFADNLNSEEKKEVVAFLFSIA